VKNAFVDSVPHGAVETDRWRLRHGPRLYFSRNIEKNSFTINLVASILLGVECHGDALFAFVEPTEMRNISITDFFDVFSTRFPVSVMGLTFPVDNLPLYFSRSLWNSNLK